MKSQSELEEDHQEKSTVPTWEELDDEDTTIKSIPPAQTRAQVAKNKEYEDQENLSETSGTRKTIKQKTVNKEENLYKKRFSRVLLFLWGMIHEVNTVKPTRLSLCTKASTEAWLDDLHDKHLKNDNSSTSTSTQVQLSKTNRI